MPYLNNFSPGDIYAIYNQFLGYFPPKLHGLVSLFLVVLLIIGIYKVLKRQLIYIILLIVLLPASGPILKNIWQQLLAVLQFLLSRK